MEVNPDFSTGENQGLGLRRVVLKVPQLVWKDED